MFVADFKFLIGTFFLCLFTFGSTASYAALKSRPIPGSKPSPTPAQSSEKSESFDLKETEAEFDPVRDRWRAFYEGHWYDPYNTNLLKGDLPIFGSMKNPWFLELGLTSVSSADLLDIPTPVGAVSTESPNSLNTLGNGSIWSVGESLQATISLYQGNTGFKPPQFEFRFSPHFNLNYARASETGALKVNPEKTAERFDRHLGIQELFADFHLADLSARYDFVSTRLGIQPFNADFRGFLYFSNEPGLRLFGNLDNNRYQFNLAYFRRLEKDTNSGLNLIQDDRQEDIFIANLYRQDFGVLGYTAQAIVLHRHDHANQEQRYNQNGFLVRPASIGDMKPKSIQSTYLGINGDGHWGRWNLSNSFYFVFGAESHNPIAERRVTILAGQAAIEVSYDINWIRPKFSFFYASGDSDPFDGLANGFDAVIESPQFAGGESGYWFRQFIPLIGGGGVGLTNKKSFLPNLSSGREEGQSNFVNPGLLLINLGCDFEVTPKLKLLSNFNFMMFDEVEVLQALRQLSALSQVLGYDFSAAALYRPFLNNNIRLKVGGAVFVPGSGFAQLFSDELRHQAFAEVVLQY